MEFRLFSFHHVWEGEVVASVIGVFSFVASWEDAETVWSWNSDCFSLMSWEEEVFWPWNSGCFSLTLGRGSKDGSQDSLPMYKDEFRFCGGWSLT